MSEKVTLRGERRDAGGWAEVEFGAEKLWPVKIASPGQKGVLLSDKEAVHLMQLLQQRYPLEALIND